MRALQSDTYEKTGNISIKTDDCRCFKHCVKSLNGRDKQRFSGILSAAAIFQDIAHLSIATTLGNTRTMMVESQN